MTKTSTDLPATLAHAESLNMAFQTAVTAFAEAMRVGTAFEVLLAFRATVATAMAMYRARPEPADQAAADAMEHELAAVDRDIASRAARLPN